MRHWIAGLSFLATVVFVAQPTSASVIENPTILFGSAQWSFSTATNLFTGGGQSLLPPANAIAVQGSLQALFDDLGNFQSGSVELRRVSDDHLLLGGDVTGISHTTVSDPPGIDSHYFLIASFIATVQDDLPFPVQFAEWHIFVCSQTGDCDTDGPASEAGLFTTDYSESSVAVNNNFRTFYVPTPPPLVLFAVALGILALTRSRIPRHQR
jgi:hypothetical protein